MKQYYITYETLTALCDAVRKISGKRRMLSPRELASLIRGAKQVIVPDDEIEINGFNITITNYTRPMVIKEYFLDNSMIEDIPSIIIDNVKRFTIEDTDELLRSPAIAITLDNTKVEESLLTKININKTFPGGEDIVQQMSIKKFSMNSSSINENIEIG